MWMVWKERNACIFKDTFANIDNMWNHLVHNIKETILSSKLLDQDLQASPEEACILNSWGLSPSPSQEEQSLRRNPSPFSSDVWSPPRHGCFKINFDGAAKGNPISAGFGGVVRDHSGELLWVFWGSIGWDSNNVAEIEGLIHSLLLIDRPNLNPLIIEGDSQIIVMLTRKLQGGHHVARITKNWRLEFCMERLAALLESTPNYSISHVKRKGNKVADLLANQGVTGTNSFIVTRCPTVSMEN